jgi:tetratricopeptide (TPR) repeat protein
MKKLAALSLVAITSIVDLFALDTSPSSIALHFGPGMQIPLGVSADNFTIGGLLDIAGEYAFTENPKIFASAGFEYLIGPLVSGQSISAIAGDAGGGVYIDITPRLGLKADASIGYNYSFLNGTGGYTGTGVTSGGSLHYAGGLGLWYLVSPSLNVGLRMGYGSCVGLNSGLSVAMGTSYYFTGREARMLRIDQGLPGQPDYLRSARTPNPDEGIRIDDVAFQDVFPVFHAYYDDHPLGRAVLHNQERRAITDITLTVFLKEYMDAPKECRAPRELKSGETADVELYGLFNKDKVLGITEATKTPAEITLEYRLKGQWYRDSRQATVRLYDRNAMSWDDDRKAAAFVTAKDPSVLRFAKNAAGAVDAEGSWTLNANLQTAMGIHEALTLYGIRYVVDPKTPYAELSQEKTGVDFLQFPRQTLEYRAGDCDDLSILYAALMESVGVRTAFITVPGHIYMAFSLDIAPEEAKKGFFEAADLIFIGNTSWIPLEVTERSGGFTQAWDKAAREWRDYSAKGQARFYDMHESWTIYAPVGLSGTQGEFALPTQSRIVAAFQKEMIRFVQKELDPQVKKLEAEIKKSGATPALQNRLGVLYARYGFADKAQAEFQKALAKQEYLPALINMGNLYFLRGTWAKALEFYERAAKKAQDNASVQLSIARTQYQLGNTDLAKKALDAVKNLDPGLAAKYAYLEAGDAESARAGMAESRGEVPWQD